MKQRRHKTRSFDWLWLTFPILVAYYGYRLVESYQPVHVQTGGQYAPK